MSLGHNVSTDDTCFLDAVGDQPSTDPQLRPLASNGGPTRTQALGPRSPALGAATDCPRTDQRGFPRPRRRCDVGAYER
ncbi:MAG: polymorphic outer membrane protein [Frankiales bacterium]|nr:polymorphic outer membrane protein [Frankiales bacterium]